MASKLRMCSVCAGRGKLQCGMCSGTGTQTRTAYSDGSPYTESVSCESCSGGYRFCENCSGSGTMSDSLTSTAGDSEVDARAGVSHRERSEAYKDAVALYKDNIESA